MARIKSPFIQIALLCCMVLVQSFWNLHLGDEREKQEQGPTSMNEQEAINFRREPNHFVEALSTCFTDDDCRIYYYHFGKTGGTGFRDRMIASFPPPEIAVDDCCHARLMNRFHSHTEAFCQAKFSSYDVRASVFLQDVLPTCMNMTRSRALVFVSFREPIARTVSAIHQLCNKNFHLRSNETLQACLRCSYEQDTAFWDKLIDGANEGYAGVLDVVSAVTPNANVLSIDMMDLDELYVRLHSVFPEMGFVMKKTVNPERKDQCNFGFKSAMMRGLWKSSIVYRNLTLGILDSQ